MKPRRTFSQIEGREDLVVWYEAYEKEINSSETVGNFAVAQYPVDTEMTPTIEIFNMKTDIYIWELYR
eukprot:snap_masked-scaffold_7-processed-gene-19.24-mRNA-1 protein AED:1.00 eAED:1.00 QI:0/-1/0/0/-1/1/1/0/67